MATPFSLISPSPLTLLTYAQGGYLRGRWQDGAGPTDWKPAVSQGNTIAVLLANGGSPTLSLFEGSVQVASPEELVNIPENQRNKEAIKIYTHQKLKTVDEVNGVKADLIVWKGSVWEVHQITEYKNMLTHNKALAFKVNP